MSSKKFTENIIKNAPATKLGQSKNEMHARMLVNSALDLSTNLYDFASWLGDDLNHSHASGGRSGDTVTFNAPGIDLKHPIAFADFNGNNQCMGAGLKALQPIDND